MRAHYLQHVHFEGLGSIASWLQNKGYETTHTAFFDEPTLPEAKTIDFLIIMGGPMSVNDEPIYPWLVAEKAFIREVIAFGKPVLGICLGAQLIASAMGAKIYPNPQKEIGWFPIEAVHTDKKDTFVFPTFFEVFHWHGETFDLPSGANLLASSSGCKNQAFQLGKNVMGLQFHLEMTADSVKEIISHSRDELTCSVYIQSEETMLSASPQHYTDNTKCLYDILEYLTQQG